MLGKLFVISAPTGGGKTTITREALKKLNNLHPPINLSRITTYTTRLPRPKEQDGKDYYFITKEEFVHKKANNLFLETSYYDGNWYGSPAEVLKKLEQGKSFLLITDRPGAQIVKKKVSKISEVVMIWITASIELITERLKKRETQRPEILSQRIKIAANEIALENKENLFSYHIVNIDLDKAVNDFISIIKRELAR